MSIDLENPESVLGKVDAARNYVAQIRLATTMGDTKRVMEAIEKADALLFAAHIQIETEEASSAPQRPK